MAQQQKPTERPIPANPEAEEAVLGSALLDPDAIVILSGILKRGDFYREKNGWIYQAMLDLHNEGKPIDFVTLVDVLERNDQLTQIGGASYLTGLLNKVPSAMNAEHYAGIVARAATLRRLIGVAGIIANLAYDETTPATEIVDKAETLILGMSERTSRNEPTPIGAGLRAVVDRLDYIQRHEGELLGVPTGFARLDGLVGGFQKSDLIVLAARPGEGKSSFAMNISLNAAKDYGQRVGVFSLEMSKIELAQRMLATESGIDQKMLRRGGLSPDEWALLMETAGRMAELPIYIDDSASLSATELRSKARKLQAEHGLDFVVVDYLQLMTGDARATNRVQEIATITRGLKALARELDVPVLALSQLSRAIETRSEKTPMLSDLRESGCLAGSSMIEIAGTAWPERIDSLVGRDNLYVGAMNLASRKVEASKAGSIFYSGVKPLYLLRLSSDLMIRATANHKFFVKGAGWKRLDALTCDDELAVRNERLAICDVSWARFVSREYAGTGKTYDITVPCYSNFVANGIICHNSIEQDSDIVMFIKKQDADAASGGLANEDLVRIVIGKHRNGPTGSFPLFFDRKRTRFLELETVEKPPY